MIKYSQHLCLLVLVGAASCSSHFIPNAHMRYFIADQERGVNVDIPTAFAYYVHGAAFHVDTLQMLRSPAQIILTSGANTVLVFHGVSAFPDLTKNLIAEVHPRPVRFEYFVLATIPSLAMRDTFTLSDREISPLFSCSWGEMTNRYPVLRGELAVDTLFADTLFGYLKFWGDGEVVPFGRTHVDGWVEFKAVQRVLRKPEVPINVFCGDAGRRAPGSRKANSPLR